MDKIVKFEELDTGLSDILQRLGKHQSAVHENASPRTDYRSYYKKDHDVDFVGEIYKRDVEEFGYNFE